MQIAVMSKQKTGCTSEPSKLSQMVVTVGILLGIGKLQMALVYSRNDHLQQVDPFINANDNATLAGANLADFVSIRHKALAKVDMVEIGLDTDVVAIVLMFTK